MRFISGSASCGRFELHERGENNGLLSNGFVFRFELHERGENILDASVGNHFMV